MDVVSTVAGDSWDTVAYRLFGDEFRMTELQLANPERLGTLVFGAGVELRIPVVDVAEVAGGLPPWKS